jgi:hypothetical protein
MWLWYSFLRTGRADIYRMAEAMTRCTQEVDAYHIGPMKGLGSRHNVRHWGDGAKEARISQAALKRFYYYLSTDERTGDLMNEVIDADLALLNVDPLRKVEKDQTYKAHVRAGPDWFAFAGNWLTAWERTGDEKYLERVMVGVKDFDAMPKKLFSGGIFGYDPATKEVKQLHDDAAMPHLAALMGGPELFFEMTPVMNKPEWTAMFLQYCRYLQSPAGEQEKSLGNRLRENQAGPWYSALTAYAARALKDPALGDRAWAEFSEGNAASKTGWEWKELSGPDVPEKVAEISSVSTNDTSQWCLNAILLLELVGDRVPEGGK